MEKTQQIKKYENEIKTLENTLLKTNDCHKIEQIVSLIGDFQSKIACVNR